MKEKKAIMLRFISSAILLTIFSLGSIAANRFAKAEAVNVTTGVVKAGAEKHQFAPFVADAFIVEIPINHIGFYSFVYPVGAAWHDVVAPVAHAPPNDRS